MKHKEAESACIQSTNNGGWWAGGGGGGGKCSNARLELLYVTTHRPSLLCSCDVFRALINSPVR